MINYQPVITDNELGEIGKASTFSSSSIFLKMQINPDTTVTTIDYYTLHNFLIAIGGLS